MVYLVKANYKKEKMETTEELFLVESRTKAVIPQHLNGCPFFTVDIKTIQVLKELNKIKLDDISVLHVGNIKKLIDLMEIKLDENHS